MQTQFHFTTGPATRSACLTNSHTAPTWSLAVRSNGQILNPLTLPQLRLFEPEHLSCTSSRVFEPSVERSGTVPAGRKLFWSVDLGGVNFNSDSTMVAYPPAIKMIATIPKPHSQMNFLCIQSFEKQLLIAGDVEIWATYSVDLETGKYVDSSTTIIRRQLNYTLSGLPARMESK